MDGNGEMQTLTTPTRRMVSTWVGQFSIVGGEAQEVGPCLGLFQGNRADGEPVDLFVLVEPVSAGSESYSQQIIDAIAEMYQQEHLSMTGGLVRAIRAAHDTLLDWNRKSLREHQVGVGVTCLAIRNEFAYIAQAGPSLAFLWSNDTLDRLSPELEESVAPLGADQPFYPEVRRIELHDGSMLTLSTSALSGIVDDSSLVEILKRGPQESVMDLFARTRHLRDFSLVLISATAEEVPVTEPEPAETLPEGGMQTAGFAGPPLTEPHLPDPEPDRSPYGPAAYGPATDTGRSAYVPPPPRTQPPLVSTAPRDRAEDVPYAGGPNQQFDAATAPPLIDDYAYSDEYLPEGPVVRSPASAYAPSSERPGNEESLYQRLRRLFGVEDQPDETQSPPRTTERPGPPRERMVTAESGPVPVATEVRRTSFPYYRDVQRVPSIGLEPDRLQLLIDRLSRMGWPVLAAIGVIVIGILVVLWLVLL